MLKADVRQRVRAAKMQAKRDTVVGRKPCKCIIGILGIGQVGIAIGDRKGIYRALWQRCNTVTLLTEPH